MAPLVDRQDPVAVRQRRKDSPIGEGVEAVGVQEEKVWGSVRRPEIEDRYRAFAATGQRLKAASEA